MKYLLFYLIHFILNFQGLLAFESAEQETTSTLKSFQGLFSKFFSSCTLREDGDNKEDTPKSSKKRGPDFPLLIYAQELIQRASPQDLKLLQNLDLFLTTPHEGIIKTWILKGLQGQDDYCQSPLELLQTYQVYQFFMDIPKNKEELVEAYFYVLRYGKDLDRMMSFRDLSKKSSLEVYQDYAYCTSFLKEIENSPCYDLPLGPGGRTIESLKEALNTYWPKVLKRTEEHLVTLSMDATHTLQKEMKAAQREATAFKEQAAVHLQDAEGQVTLNVIDEMIELQEQFIYNETAQKRTSFEKRHWANETLHTLPFYRGPSFGDLLSSSNSCEKQLAFLFCLEADMMQAELKSLAWQEVGLLYKGLRTVLKYEFKESWGTKIEDIYKDLKAHVKQ